MDMKVSSAARAYSEALQRAAGAVGDDDAAPVGKSKGASFADFVRVAVSEPVAAVHKSEQMTAAAAAGKADMAEVVMAVTNAEMAIETVTAVRDRVVSAYQEILRMPI
jgi:flagellar hook-basal body complex protein FliE